MHITVPELVCTLVWISHGQFNPSLARALPLTASLSFGGFRHKVVRFLNSRGVETKSPRNLAWGAAPWSCLKLTLGLNVEI
jgi:hypothetical protein